MSQFDTLLIGHLIGDFLFQTGWMAQYKSTKWLPLITHVLVYTIVISLFGWFSGGLTWLAILLVFLSHLFLDRRTFVVFWVRRIQTAKGPSEAWLTIVADQIFHLIILAIAIYIS